MSFVHLHAHSEYSTLDGINRTKEIPKHIKSLGMKAVAQTDHGNLAGCWEFVKACRAEEVQPIVGMEAYMTPGDRTEKKVDHLGRPYYHLILLADSNEGLHNLIKLSSIAYDSGFYRKPRVDPQCLSDHSEGIIATSACAGSFISQLVLRNELRAAEEVVCKYREIFNQKFVLELQPHQSEDQKTINEILMQISKKYKIPLIVSADAHYTHVSDKELHEITLCVQTNSSIKDNAGDFTKDGSGKRFSFGPIQVPLASPDWMREQCIACGIPLSAMKNTVSIAKRIDSDSYFLDRKNRFPIWSPDVVREIERECKWSLYRKFGNQVPPKEYRDRLDVELRSLKRLGYLDYMMIQKKIVEIARDLNVPIGPGRGSAAGSLVAWALEITQVDPIKHQLIYERFANEGRGASPMIFNKEMVEQIEKAKVQDQHGSNPRACSRGCNDHP